jgi:hypothetical protein
MTTTELERAHKAQPFRPFTLHLAGGRSVRVDHPEMMAYTPKSRVTVVFKKDGDFEIIDLLLVESIEVEAGGRRRAG